MSGLREALERLATRWEGMDTPGLVSPSNHRWAEGVDRGYDQAAADLRDLLAAHPADPAPCASRERVAEVLREAGDIHPHIILSGWFGHAADALLAAGVFRDEATVKAEVAEQIAAKADEIAEGCSKSAADHRSIAIEIGSKLPKGRTHMATALAFSHQAAGAWAVAEAAREIGGTS